MDTFFISVDQNSVPTLDQAYENLSILLRELKKRKEYQSQIKEDLLSAEMEQLEAELANTKFNSYNSGTDNQELINKYSWTKLRCSAIVKAGKFNDDMLRYIFQEINKAKYMVSFVQTSIAINHASTEQDKTSIVMKSDLPYIVDENGEIKLGSYDLVHDDFIQKVFRQQLN
jgi:hypothetical protein